MAEEGYITAAQADTLSHTPPPPLRRPVDNEGRYFADWIADQVISFAGPDHGDLVVQTTLDVKIQHSAEVRLETVLSGPAIAAHVAQGSVLVMSPDGAIRAMVGGRDYRESQFNRAVQSLRQPGSSFKPIIYLAAMQAGMTPDSLVDDAPLRIGNWEPANYEPGFKGMIPLREALANSVNTAAVRILQHVGIPTVRHLAGQLGITSPLGRDLSLALGTSEVSLLEITSVYAGFASGGAAIWPYAITSVHDREGKEIYRRKADIPDAVANPAAVANLTEMMTGVIEYGTGKAARLDRPAAGKTGTTQDYRDAWFIGFTADYVAGVWLGNDDNAPMKRITGGTLPAHLWHDIMTDAETGLPMRPLPSLSGQSSAAAPPIADPAPEATSVSVPAEEGIAGLLHRLTGQ
jgi:penicillin-binding protein 1A